MVDEKTVTDLQMEVGMMKVEIASLKESFKEAIPEMREGIKELREWTIKTDATEKVKGSIKKYLLNNARWLVPIIIATVLILPSPLSLITKSLH